MWPCSTNGRGTLSSPTPSAGRGRTPRNGAIKQNGHPCGRPFCGDARPCGVGSGFGDDDDLDGGLDVGVQVDQHVVLADVAEGAFAQDDFALADRQAGSGEGIGDFAGADRAVQLAFGRSVGRDGHARAVQLGLAGVSVGVDGLGLGFVFGALGFELGLVALGGRNGLALRHEEVTAV